MLDYRGLCCPTFLIICLRSALCSGLRFGAGTLGQLYSQQWKVKFLIILSFAAKDWWLSVQVEARGVYSTQRLQLTVNRTSRAIKPLMIRYQKHGQVLQDSPSHLNTEWWMLMIIISRHPPHTLPPTDSQYYHLGLNILRINSVNVRTFHLIRRKLKPIINLKLGLVSGMKCTAVGLETWSDDNGNKIMTGEMTDMRLQIQIATLSFSLCLKCINSSQLYIKLLTSPSWAT